MEAPDVMVYPDSGKVGIFGGAAPGGPEEERTFSKFLRTDAEVGYYDGEGWPFSRRSGSPDPRENVVWASQKARRTWGEPSADLGHMSYGANIFPAVRCERHRGTGGSVGRGYRDSDLGLVGKRLGASAQARTVESRRLPGGGRGRPCRVRDGSSWKARTRVSVAKLLRVPR